LTHLVKQSACKELNPKKIGGGDSSVCGRSVKPDIECGICGEYGGEPKSIFFCHKIGLTYVSCSQFRVPTARLEAAHAALRETMTRKNEETTKIKEIMNVL